MAIENRSRAQVFPKIGKFSMVIFALAFVIAGFRAYEIFGYVFKPNVNNNAIVYIPTGATFETVEKILMDKNHITDVKALRWIAKKKKYKQNVKPGRYEIKKDWNTNQLVNLLRIGQQSPVMVTFNNVRFFEDLAGKVSSYFEADSATFIKTFKDKNLQKKYNFNEETFASMFIPNSYQMFWTSTPEEFVAKMNKEYNKFWNESRKAKAKALNLSPLEVSTLASIVQEETVKSDEKSKVAGLYINRLKRGMLLQADPTIKFAIHDFMVRRITNVMLQVESPYNTYKNAGLPPGPINFAEISSIDAVLTPDNHNFLYMCAKEDFSGYHNFARTLSQHNTNAARYRRALDKNKIWR